MNLTAEQWAYIVGVALPDIASYFRYKTVDGDVRPILHINAVVTLSDDFYEFHRLNDASDFIRLAYERATDEQKVKIMAMVLGGKDE